MAPPLIAFAKSRRAANAMTASVYVDAKGVEEAIEAVESSVDEHGSMYFLRMYVNPYFEDQIVDIFAGHGAPGFAGGQWAPLTDTTLRIRHAQGHMDDEAWNERTGELLEYVSRSRDYEYLPGGAQMQIPGNGGDAVLKKKLETAQHGSHDNKLFPGSYTPPRPVLYMDEVDVASVMTMLHIHIAKWTSSRMKSIGSAGP